ncbi:hypothetical protein H0O02_02425 [Candidatus Micrarchaeota archaeon]|nr:hypothetical protein [Candidatus Micrarchaeota archaeon]
MTVEKMKIKAVQKKPLSQLATLLGNLGFTKISYSKETLSIEKMRGYDLKGKPELDYMVVFGQDNIELAYNVPPKKNNRARLVEVMPVFLNVIQLAEEYYEIKPSSIYFEINTVLSEMLKLTNKDAVDFSTELSELQAKHKSFEAKYADLLRSSEENARILLECERKRDELSKRVEQLEKMNDEALKEMLYDWIKLNRISIPRVEEGLNLLITEGYIKRRFE